MCLSGFDCIFFNKETSGINLLNESKVNENICLSAFYTFCINLAASSKSCLIPHLRCSRVKEPETGRHIRS